MGRLSPEKGLEFIITGMVDIVKVYPNTKLIIVGSGNEEYKLKLQETIKQLGLSSNILLVGFVDDITKILRCLDIYCLSSLTEGCNRTLLEAMAVGLPVVATAVGGNVEIVEDSVNGILVPPNDPRGLASAILDLLKDKKRSDKMGKTGRKVIFEKFGIKKNVQLTQSIYEEIISRK